ncbi:hypothetical protein V6Z11_A13G042100 [Gossypium hirsutum]
MQDRPTIRNPAYSHPSPIPTPTPSDTIPTQLNHAPGHWTTGLCHCFDDPANCVITCICPCITFGQVAEIVSRGSKCKVHFCCCPLALCQEYRELKNRGFDMEIGWEANMDRQKRGVAMIQ